jgi:hypothetical protein
VYTVITMLESRGNKKEIISIIFKRFVTVSEILKKDMTKYKNFDGHGYEFFAFLENTS